MRSRYAAPAFSVNAITPLPLYFSALTLPYLARLPESGIWFVPPTSSAFSEFSSEVIALPWVDSVPPCWVTVFCRLCSAVASAFLLTLELVVDRSLVSFVMALLAAVRSFPCCVTVFCSVCTVLASAFLLTLAFVVDSPFSSVVVRFPILVSMLPCWLTVVVRESTAFAVASAAS